MSTKRKRQSVKKKGFIAENLKQFLPPVSRMGGLNPSGWGWSKIMKQVGQGPPKKVA